ncbi:single-stranded DNA-binding protein [Sphingopyxis sp. H038]|uniref:single-stranded DNA-binding protein n=1 Tax=unclassified Sphingopyxis TaxID=2614943 RepID=UPI0007312047|nr:MULTISPECIES: single-stranded DNA-binding protein [unclassified Sphingopyxis]KTE02899.1 single-stranded DNA-binding protein [Sphingopyxis sp. H012]KTE04917.1 single-stranded DNA-binding protein [Sphingopyxis sp. H093]KTE10279.1 single-stranded DNA-binding protein [Sphingopyxis sp. H053]KTE23242.1 single-stranded DNA-binding protein [Sphingopyxis sp. H080]KTE31357.1 single-stranded DNA-binding protein [Sphingopyxis sp. H038]
MQNCADFHIIGRVGKVDAKDKVTYLDVAANYPRKDGDSWKDDTHWNSVTCFGKMHERAAKIGKGDLVRITGRVRQNSYESNGERHYTVDLIVDRMATIIKAGGAPADRDDDVQDDNVPF